MEIMPDEDIEVFEIINSSISPEMAASEIGAKVEIIAFGQFKKLFKKIDYLILSGEEASRLMQEIETLNRRQHSELHVEKIVDSELIGKILREARRI